MTDEKPDKNHWLNGFTEFARAGAEAVDYKLNASKLLEVLPQGNGTPILFLPGFLTGDWAMNTMRKFFDELGYEGHKWECGTNWGSSEKRMQALKERFEELVNEYPNQKIALVGWSLGGIYARELARAYPDNVCAVVTLGAPFGVGQDTDRLNPVLRRVFETLNPDSPLLNDDELIAQAVTPPPVPTTSLFSKADGIVYWRASLNPDTPLSENIDMTHSNPIGAYASHSGFNRNQFSMTVVADRLAESLSGKEWTKFDPTKYDFLEGKVCVNIEDKDLPPSPVVRKAARQLFKK